MPEKWDAAKHEKVLLAYVKHCKVDFSMMAKACREEYGTGSDVPTKGALEQHFHKMPKKAGGVIAAAKKTPVKTTLKTPSKLKQSPVKTPTSGSKRKKPDTSDEDDNDGDVSDSEEISHEVGRRSSLTRRSKSATIDYAQLNGGKTDDDNEASDELLQPPMAAGNGVSVEDPFNFQTDFDGDLDGGMFDHGISFDGVGEVSPLANHNVNRAASDNNRGPNTFVGQRGTPRKMRKMFDFEEDSDGSVFDPMS